MYVSSINEVFKAIKSVLYISIFVSVSQFLILFDAFFKLIFFNYKKITTRLFVHYSIII